MKEIRKRAPGGGRKPKPPGEKRIKVAITMRPDLYESTAGNRSAEIEAALDFYKIRFGGPKTETTTVTITTSNEPKSEYKFTYGVNGFIED